MEPSASHPRLCPGNARSAFTLVELLVCITVIGVLVTLALPALAGARSGAQRTASLANLRTIGQLFSLYASSSRELYPCPEPGREYTQMCDGAVVGPVPHWEAQTYYPFLLNDPAGWDEHRAAYLAPAARRDEPPGPFTCGFPPSYYYSRSFLARPSAWSGDSPPDPQLLRGAAAHEVHFPAVKVLAWEWELPYVRRDLRFQGPDLAEPTPMLFADTHAEQRIPARASAAVMNPFSGDVRRLANTPSGVHGWDY